MTSSPAEVDEVLVQAETAGAHIARPGGERCWGGYTGVFVDGGGRDPDAVMFLWSWPEN